MPVKDRPHRLVLVNDGGTLLGPTLEAPMGIEGLVRLTIDPLVNTQVDTLYWQLGTDLYQSTPTHRYSDIYSHNTEVGPRWGDDQASFESSGAWRIYENTRQLMSEGTDPPAVLIEHGHRAGLEVFLSMRVNDIHDGLVELADPSYLSRTKREHPEWLPGPVSNPAREGRLSRFSRFAYNFEIDEVREYKLALATEAINNYDLDGLDWDFCRFPRFFPEGRAERNAGLITDLLRSIRSRLDAKAKKAGRRLLLSVRVSPTIDLALAFGLDVNTWIREGLIDLLVAGVVHASMHRVPVETFVEAARGTGVQVLAQNLGLFWWGRPLSARVLWNEPDLFTPEMCRASAATYWQAGVDGICLWNNHLIRFNRDLEYDRQPWKEIADPALIAKRDKHYVVDNPHNWQDVAAELGAPPVPAGPLPVALQHAGDTASVKIDIADDAERGNGPEETVLRLLVINLTSQDHVEYTLNGKPLDPSRAQSRLLYNDCWTDFHLQPGTLKRGWNQLTVTVTARNPRVAAPLTLESVEVIVRYPR